MFVEKLKEEVYDVVKNEVSSSNIVRDFLASKFEVFDSFR